MYYYLDKSSRLNRTSTISFTYTAIGSSWHKRNAERYQHCCKAAGLVPSHYTTSVNVVGSRLTFDLNSGAVRTNTKAPPLLHVCQKWTLHRSIPFWTNTLKWQPFGFLPLVPLGALCRSLILILQPAHYAVGIYYLRMPVASCSDCTLHPGHDFARA